MTLVEVHFNGRAAGRDDDQAELTGAAGKPCVVTIPTDMDAYGVAVDR